MGMEAQRIMAASMTKIQSSRNRRTGVDLHRNLLITTVLHKARTVFLADSYTSAVNLRENAQKRIEEQKNKLDLSKRQEESDKNTENQEPDNNNTMDSDCQKVADNIEESTDNENTTYSCSYYDYPPGPYVVNSEYSSDDYTEEDTATSPLDISDHSLDCDEHIERFSDDDDEILSKCEPVLHTLLPAKSNSFSTYADEFNSPAVKLVEENCNLSNTRAADMDYRLMSADCDRDCVRNCSSKRCHDEDSEDDDDDVFCEAKKFRPNMPSEDSEEDYSSCQVTNLVSIFNNGLAGLTNSLSRNSLTDSLVAYSTKDSCSITLKEESFTSSLSRPILAMAMV